MRLLFAFRQEAGVRGHERDDRQPVLATVLGADADDFQDSYEKAGTRPALS